MSNFTNFNTEKLLDLIVLAIFTIVIFGTISAFLIMIIWNITIVTIFPVPQITFFDAWGIFILANILFKPHPSLNSSNSK